MLLSLELFIMLVLANGSPVLVERLLRERGAWPVDGGRCWQDGRPLFGRSKTWRGVLAGTLSCLIFGALVGLGWVFSGLFGLLALTGDLISSFIKRRRGFSAGARAPGLDQLPEALLPMLLAWAWLPLAIWQVILVTLCFALGNIWVSPMLYRLGIRSQPH
ncbi:MAG TPA: CDP-archaeol synthase [Marinobacter sp.]|nr:CDP-archaeol synthase [Marinobacter sp.]